MKNVKEYRYYRHVHGAQSVVSPNFCLSTQVDLDFDSLSDVDEFWNTLPQQEHRAWLQRMQVRHFTALISSHDYWCLQKGWVTTLRKATAE